MGGCLCDLRLESLSSSSPSFRFPPAQQHVLQQHKAPPTKMALIRAISAISTAVINGDPSR